MGTDTRNGLDEKTVQWDHVRSLGGASPAAFSGDEQHKLTSLLNLFPMPGPLNGHRNGRTLCVQSSYTCAL